MCKGRRWNGGYQGDKREIVEADRMSKVNTEWKRMSERKRVRKRETG